MRCIPRTKDHGKHVFDRVAQYDRRFDSEGVLQSVSAEHSYVELGLLAVYCLKHSRGLPWAEQQHGLHCKLLVNASPRFATALLGRPQLNQNSVLSDSVSVFLVLTDSVCLEHLHLYCFVV